MTDRDFGKLTYMGGYCEGDDEFPATRRGVEYFMVADIHGPTPGNKRALELASVNYSSLAEKAASVISEKVGTVVGQP